MPAKDANTLKTCWVLGCFLAFLHLLRFLVPRTGQPFKLLGRLFLVFEMVEAVCHALTVLAHSGCKTIVCQAWVRVSAHAVHTQLICLAQAETKNLIDTIRLRLRKVPPKIGLPVTTAKRMHIMRRSGSKHLGSCPLLVSRAGECSHFFLLCSFGKIATNFFNV